MSKQKLMRPGRAAGRALALAKSDLGATVAAELHKRAEAHVQAGFAYDRGRGQVVYAENVLCVAGVPASRVPVLCRALRAGSTGRIDWRKELGLPKQAGPKAIIGSLPSEPTAL